MGLLSINKRETLRLEGFFFSPVLSLFQPDQRQDTDHADQPIQRQVTVTALCSLYSNHSGPPPGQQLLSLAWSRWV